MSIAILGDTHGRYDIVAEASHKAKQKNAAALIHVGDFGIHKDMVQKMSKMKFLVPVYIIDGNHEDFRIINTYSKNSLTEIRDNVFYVPRGYVMELNNKIIGFCGGATSVDKEWQLRNTMYHGTVTWFPEEEITDENILKFDAVNKLDLLITHVPPQSVIQYHLDPNNLRFFGLPITWKDPSADKIEFLWNKFDKPLIISGHIHRSCVGKNYRTLDINELIFI